MGQKGADVGQKGGDVGQKGADVGQEGLMWVQWGGIAVGCGATGGHRRPPRSRDGANPAKSGGPPRGPLRRAGGMRALPHSRADRGRSSSAATTPQPQKGRFPFKGGFPFRGGSLLGGGIPLGGSLLGDPFGGDPFWGWGSLWGEFPFLGGFPFKGKSEAKRS